MDLFQADYAIVADASTSFQVLNRFINSTKHDVVVAEAELSVSGEVKVKDIFNSIKGLVKEARAVSYSFQPCNYVIYGKKDDIDVLIFIDPSARNYRYESDEDDFDQSGDDKTRKFTLRFFSTFEIAEELRKQANKLFEQHNAANIKWWHVGTHGPEERQIFLSHPKAKLCAEFYPDLGDPYKFMDEYLKSDAAVLLMTGPPGTGKTTLLRHLITERKLSAHIIYDEKLMNNDMIFQRFLFDQNSDIMVIEDADTILLGREDDGNKMMARFLSVSDGLIKLPNKKLVFTTNLSDFSRVDQALLRPGRCFGVVHTRPLNLQEAQAACKVAELPSPTEKGEYTLAELFNQKSSPRLRKIGFTG